MNTRIVLAGLLLLLAPFQNCGQFRAANLTMTASMAQCRASYANEALRVQALAGRDLACAEPTSYACERRVFVPGQNTRAVKTRECLGGADFCVDVVTRYFDTEPARTSDNSAAFAAGADYNHVESRCTHRWVYRGQTVIEDEQAAIADALANVRQACVRAEGDFK